MKESGLIETGHKGLSEFIYRATKNALTASNSIRLLINGEEKFSALMEALKKATHHIHIEYYIFESDRTGTEIVKILIQKAREGVKVRFIYDDFGSHSLGKGLIAKMKSAGIEVAPFYKINLLVFASRINYRNHRKIVVIDGNTSFVGGINVSDKYRNDTKEEGELYWRDTHLQITGNASAFLQVIFIGDWNFSSGQSLPIEEKYFPKRQSQDTISPELAQIIPSGPDSDLPAIFYSLIKAISLAKKQISITSPYLIPGDSLMDALLIAAGSGVKVRVIVPFESDSRLVNAAANSYYSELLPVGVEIFRYKKGFVHAKTMVVDDDLSFVGTANMDYRSFDLNFEVNTVVYGHKMASELKQAFEQDMEMCEQINHKAWLNRPRYLQLIEKTARLLSPFL